MTGRIVLAFLADGNEKDASSPEDPPTWRDALIALPFVWVVFFVTASFRVRIKGETIEI